MDNKNSAPVGIVLYVSTYSFCGPCFSDFCLPGNKMRCIAKRGREQGRSEFPPFSTEVQRLKINSDESRVDLMLVHDGFY